MNAITTPDTLTFTAADEALRDTTNPFAYYPADAYEDLLLDWADETWEHGDDDSLAAVWASEVSRG